MFRPGRRVLRQAGGAGGGTSFVADEERKTALVVGGEVDVDPELDEEPDVDLEPADSEREDEPDADPDASAINDKQSSAAGQRSDGAG